MKRIGLALTFALSVVSASAGGDWFVGPQVGFRSNNVRGEQVEGSKAVVGFNAGLNILGDIGSAFRFDGSLLYTQRGSIVDFPGFGNFLPPFSTEAIGNYFDFSLGLDWYVLGTAGLLQPFVGVAAKPGFFLNGTTTRTYGGQFPQSPETEDIDSDDIESFHFAVMPQVGLDVQIGSLLLGGAVGYELGLTNIDPPGSITSSETYTNAIVVNLRLAIPIGRGAGES